MGGRYTCGCNLAPPVAIWNAFYLHMIGTMDSLVRNWQWHSLHFSTYLHQCCSSEDHFEEPLRSEVEKVPKDT